MQNVLVTGGAGFIGSHLCQKLLNDNYSVYCVDNYISGSKKNVEALLENANFHLIQHDVIKPLTESSTLPEKINFIFHLASPASPNAKSSRSYIANPIETLLVNSIGTYHLLELARKDNARFFFASTSEIYGDPHVSPQPETYFGNVNPNGVRSMYDESKRYGEAITMAFYRKYQLDVRIVRFFNSYGPNMHPDDGRVVSSFITEALKNEPITVFGNGSQTRSFCFIDDTVRGICELMFRDNLAGEVVNIGNPNEKTVLELATIVKGLTGSSSEIIYEPLPQDDPKRRCPDITKAKKLLDWEPKVSLEEGLTKTIAYFKSL